MGRYYSECHFGNNWCQKRFKDQMTTEFILASNLIMLVFIRLGNFHNITGQLLLKEISLKVNFMSLLDNGLHNKSTIELPSKSLSNPNHNFYRQILFIGIKHNTENSAFSKCTPGPTYSNRVIAIFSLSFD